MIDACALPVDQAGEGVADGREEVVGCFFLFRWIDIERLLALVRC